jgi:hypothetical protein
MYLSDFSVPTHEVFDNFIEIHKLEYKKRHKLYSNKRLIKSWNNEYAYAKGLNEVLTTKYNTTLDNLVNYMMRKSHEIRQARKGIVYAENGKYYVRQFSFRLSKNLCETKREYVQHFINQKQEKNLSIGYVDFLKELGFEL